MFVADLVQFPGVSSFLKLGRDSLRQSQLDYRYLRHGVSHAQPLP